ncbi:MAG: tetratricopeptide repeat protein [Candidatus Handelsmanbacteria bacterium]|nr:tetratricopeptide repeat protein [Candidatus Handelsmanbacteria bacterium]
MNIALGLLLLGALGCDPPQRHELQPALAPQPVEVYQEAWRRSPGDLQGLRQLGWALLLQQRFGEAIEAFEQLVRQAPEDPDAYYYLGVALARQQRKGEAIRALENALALAPGLAEGQWGLALLYNERVDGYEGALEACARGLEVAPNNAYGHFVLGFVRVSRGDNEPATAALARAIELDPALAQAHYYLAMIHLRLGREEEATAAVERTLEADPEYTEAYYTLGTLYARAGRMTEGQQLIELFQKRSDRRMQEDHYRRLLYQQATPLEGREKAAAHHNLGLAYLGQQRFDAAFQQFESALRADSANAEAWHNLGAIHSRRGQYTQAASCFKRALALKPAYVLASRNLAQVQLLRAEYAAAELSFRQVVAQGGTAEDYHGLGTALIQQGRIREGEEARARARAMGGKP